MPRPRFSISITPALRKALERERWRRKARSMSALIESLLWQALDQSAPPPTTPAKPAGRDSTGGS
jgi:hypothetical protein